MSTRFTWMLGVVILVSIGLLAACGSHYSASSDGLVIVPSQGSAAVQSFSFNLSNGHVSQINTSPTVSSVPSAIILDSTGTYAYVTSSASSAVSGSSNLISSYKINSDGTLASASTATVNGTPVAVTMDSGGKFLFVADGLASTVSVFSIGSGGTLSEVGAPFPVPSVQGGGPANLVSLAMTPTVFPSQNAQCSPNAPPTAEFLYVADAENNVLWEFSVSASGALVPPPPSTSVLSFPTGSIPSGVAIDPCNRFLYVANQNTNNLSAYTVNADGSLVAVAGSPFSAGNGPGPLVVSPFGTFLYVVDKASSAVSGFQISQASGSLSPLSPATVATGTTPVSIAIRSDDNWLFVTNNGSASGNGSVSQYAITPATGTLNPSGSGITTDTFPWGVAVK